MKQRKEYEMPDKYIKLFTEHFGSVGVSCLVMEDMGDEIGFDPNTYRHIRGTVIPLDLPIIFSAIPTEE